MYYHCLHRQHHAVLSDTLTVVHKSLTKQYLFLFSSYYSFKKVGRSGRDECGVESKGLEPLKTEIEGLKPSGDKHETHVGEVPYFPGCINTWNQQMRADVHEMKTLQHSIESKVKELRALTEQAKTDPESLREQYGSVERGLKEGQKQSAALKETVKARIDGVADRTRKRNENVNREIQRMQKWMEETEKELFQRKK